MGTKETKEDTGKAEELAKHRRRVEYTVDGTDFAFKTPDGFTYRRFMKRIRSNDQDDQMQAYADFAEECLIWPMDAAELKKKCTEYPAWSTDICNNLTALAGADLEGRLVKN